MEHNDAVRLQAVEKYMLGELSPDVRDEFEAHFFDCAVCSFNLRAGITFATGARQFFTEDQANKMHQTSPGWLAWLKPLIAAPIMAALLLVVGYQYFSAHGNESSSEVQAWYSLNDSTVHGSSGSHIEAQQGKAFHLMFDIPDAPQNAIDATLRIDVRDSEGKVVLKKILPARLAQKSVILDIPADFKEGNYRIIVFDETTGSTAPVQELPFTVAFSSRIQQH